MRPAPLFALLLAACASDGEPADGPPPDGPGEPVVPSGCDGVEAELGVGTLAWTPVSDGDTVFLYRGSQGGWHLFLAVRARGMDPSDVVVDYRYEFAESGEAFGEDTWNVILRNDVGGGWFERLGIPAAVDDAYWSSSHLIRGRDARVSATITDGASGCRVQDAWTVHIAEDPGT